LAIWREYN